MAANPQADLRVEALADRALMAPRSLARRYPQVMGITPAKSAEKLRIAAAMALLEGLPNVARVAHACGFGCTATFIRAFKRQRGLSPAAWIEQRLREQGMTDEERDVLLQQIDD